MHAKVPIEFEKPTDIVAMLRHFFRVTAVEEGCAVRIIKYVSLGAVANIQARIGCVVSVLVSSLSPYG